MSCLKCLNGRICKEVVNRTKSSRRLYDPIWPPTCLYKVVGSYPTRCACIAASIALNDEWWINHSVTYLGIELLVLLKIWVRLFLLYIFPADPKYTYQGLMKKVWKELDLVMIGDWSFSRKKVSMWKVRAWSDWFNFDLFKNHYELPRNLDGNQKYSVVHGQKFLATKIAQKTLYCQKLKCITQGRRSCNSLECSHRVLPFSWRNPWHAALWRAWTQVFLSHWLLSSSWPKCTGSGKALCNVHDVANWVCESWSLS